MSDLKFALRQLLKKPGFAVLATLTLTLGIGANLALFAILNELLLRPKPVARPDELWAIQPANPAGEAIAVNACRPYYEAMRQHGRVFNGVIGYAGVMPKLRTREGAERVYAQLVSGDYFSFLGVTPALGRAFLPEEDATLGTHSVAVISHAFWQNHFGGAANVLGRTFSLNGMQVEVVGVAPRAFTGLDFAQPVMWLPSSMEFLLNEFTSYHFVGRLAEPNLAAAAEDLLSPVAAEVTKELSGFKDRRFSRYGYTSSFLKVRLDPIGRGSLGVSFGRKRILGFLRFAAVATGLLLLIACANVANLFLARALQRRREMATRLALGATRGRLVRQLLGEGVVIAALGTIGALLAFSWMGGIIARLGTWWGGPALVPRLDIRLVLFAAGVTLVVGIGFALFPALQATGFQLFGALRSAEGGAGSGRKHAWLRHGLIVTQVVGSLVLLCAATLCLRSMRHQLSVDVGFRSDQLAIATLGLERVGHTTNTVLPQLEEIVRRISLLPGVEQAGVSATEPLTGAYSAQGVTRVEGYRAPDGKHATLRFADVGPGALAALGVPVLYGRDITTADVELRRNSIVVNEACVKQFWPDQDPLGKHIDNFEVVGVVKDFRFDRFDAPAEPMMFRTPRRSDLLHAKLLVRTRSNPRHVIAALRTELARIHPGLVKQEICTLRDTMRNALTIQNTALRILAILGGLALALAVIGTYGVMAYMVTNRTREIGVRLAVGATRGNIITLILRAGLRLGVIALAIGLPISLGLARLLRHLLTGVNPFDPISFGAVAALILAALMVACWLPARRAARVHPMAALRHE